MATEMKKLFTERVSLAPGSPSWLQVRLSGRGLGDDQTVALAKFVDQLLGGATKAEPPAEVLANVELAENAIGSPGLVAVLDALEKHHVSCKCLKLYKNKIGDEGGVRLARMVANQTSVVEELHLSHNVLTQRSLVALCMAMGKNDGYPLLGRSRLYIPCWLRLEYNSIARPLEAVDILRREGEVPICLAENRDECGPWRCSCAGRTQRGIPKVHLFTIAVQSRSNRPAAQEDTELREEMRRWGARAGPPAPSVRIPSAPRPAGNSPVGPGVASPATRPGGVTPKTGGATPGTGRGWGSPLGSAGPPPAWPAMANVVQAEVPAADTQREDEAARPAAPAAKGDTPRAAAANGKSPRVPAQAQAPAAEPPSVPPTRPPQAAPVPPTGPPARWPAPAAPACAGVGVGVGGHPGEGVAAGAAGKSIEVNAAASPARNRAWETSGKKEDSGRVEDKPAPGDAASKGSARKAQEAATPPTAPPSSSPVANGAAASAGRCSLLLDRTGKRRIAPSQLEGSEGSNGQFVCMLCNFVMVRPVMTTCCHLFCDTCFKDYVGEQVNKHKSKAAGASVPLLQCPQKNCTTQLRKQDITSLDKATADPKAAGAAQLLQRLRNALRVRCVHHPDHYGSAFGKEAEGLSRTRRVTCEWVGELSQYDSHLCKYCGVEPLLGHKAEAASAEPAPNGVGAAPKAPAAAAAPKRPEVPVGETGEVRVARYDYIPQDTDRAQIALKANDLVRVFEVTESGWAAGVLLSKRTQEEVGAAGWFPAAYLSPSGHAAAEAA